MVVVDYCLFVLVFGLLTIVLNYFGVRTLAILSDIFSFSLLFKFLFDQLGGLEVYVDYSLTSTLVSFQLNVFLGFFFFKFILHVVVLATAFHHSHNIEQVVDVP